MKIGAYYFAVQEETELRDAFDTRLAGQIDYVAQTITIDPTLPASRQKIVMLHEILHGVSFVHELGLEERAVDQTANGLAAVFEDNPAIWRLFE